MNDTKLDINYIESKIQNILDREFKNDSQRRVIKPFNDRLNFCCPSCGDGKSPYNKRGNFYVKTGTVKCFNCDYFSNFNKFCDTFNEEIDLDKRIEIYNYIDANTTYIKADDHFIESLDKLIDIEDWVNFYNTNKESNLIDIKPIQKGSQVHNYLTKRYIFDFTNIYQGIYRKKKNGKTYYSTNVLISLNRTQDKIVGFQLRNLESEKNKRFYKIVEFDEIYNFMNSEKIDEIEAISYNKLSHFYSILSTNFDDDVIIFEGFLDSLFAPLGSSIGLIGANSTNDILKFLLNADENLKLKFFFDNDKKGRKKAIELIEKGYSVFLWKKLFEDLSKGKDKQAANAIYNKISDLNELVKLSKNPNIYKKLKLNNYFSKDEFDKYYI